jgi:vesicle-fusing ATPase
MEITHSRTEEEIASIVTQFRHVTPQIVDYPQTHRARLIKPALGFDSAAIALSFVPAAGEALVAGRSAHEDDYTYHHLRRDLFQICTDSGIEVGSRYIVPTSHLTVGRFITQSDFQTGKTIDSEKVKTLISSIEQINSWLEEEYWPKPSGTIKHGGEWIVGQEKGLDCRMGRLWYGGGVTIQIGSGF